MTEEVTAITQIELVKDGSTYSLVFTGRNKHGDILVTSIVPGSIDRFKADHQLPKEIDEERVGCCKVVDVAAKLQEELDECRNMNLSLHEDIKELKDSNIEDLKEQKRLELKLHHAKSDYEIMRTNHCNTVAKLREDIRGLEVELSARKEDYAVFMKVVEIVKNWDDSTGRAFPTLIKILDELVDYTDAPEGPPETPIDDLYRVSVFLEMP